MLAVVRRYFRGLDRYLYAVARHGWEWLTGSAALAFLGLVDAMTPGGLPLWVWSMLLFSGVAMALFKAWQFQWRRYESLRRKVIRKRVKEAWRKRLMELRNEGISIRNKSYRLSASDVPDWCKEIEAWWAKSVDTIAQQDEVEAEAFRKLGHYTPRPSMSGGNYLSSDHLRYETMLTELYDRLPAIAGVHGGVSIVVPSGGGGFRSSVDYEGAWQPPITSTALWGNSIESSVPNVTGPPFVLLTRAPPKT